MSADSDVDAEFADVEERFLALQAVLGSGRELGVGV
jgi:hypothetical protein